MTIHPPLATWKLALFALLAAVSYWIAFSIRSGAAVILLALPCVFLLHRVRTDRQAFYLGLVTGVAALALYLIAGLPIAVFVLLTHLAQRRLPPKFLILLMPI